VDRRVGFPRVEGKVDRVDIVVKGRRVDVSDRFREHVEIKLAKLERLDHKAFRVDVELSRERNPRLSGVRERVELTVFTRGPVIRAEASASDSRAALDLATSKLMERMRRAADRRVRRHTHAASPADLDGSLDGSAESPAGSLPAEPAAAVAARPTWPDPFEGGVGASDDQVDASSADPPAGFHDYGASPMVVREKTHVAPPMTLDDALSNMELVGHDFYLYRDAGSGLPSVVYRRHGYDYGVIKLQNVDGAVLAGTPASLSEILGATVAR
jgi:ribosomal subunit interface protein